MQQKRKHTRTQHNGNGNRYGFRGFVFRAYLGNPRLGNRRALGGNVMFIAIVFTFLCLATALFMGASGSLGFALIALFCAFLTLAVSVAAMFLSDI